MAKINLFAMLLVLMMLFIQSQPSIAADDLKVGEAVPEFSALDDQGKKWNSKDHIDKKILVIYFCYQ